LYADAIQPHRFITISRLSPASSHFGGRRRITAAERVQIGQGRHNSGDAVVRADAGAPDRPIAIRTRLALQITDDAVKGMAHTLNRYGASPLHAEIVLTKKYGEQTFYEVKFVFPRGDSTSLLFGFDPNGKTTGVAIGSLAGD